MTTSRNGTRRSYRHVLISLAVALGVAFGSYGIASAAGGSGSGTTTNAAPTQTAAPSGAPPGANAANPWGRQRSDETVLTGDALAKVKAIALAKLPGATIVRIETDADGHAAYEAHMLKADGSPATVYVDKDFTFVSIETR
jgi:hypothetical protein